MLDYCEFDNKNIMHSYVHMQAKSDVAEQYIINASCYAGRLGQSNSSELKSAFAWRAGFVAELLLASLSLVWPTFFVKALPTACLAREILLPFFHPCMRTLFPMTVMAIGTEFLTRIVSTCNLIELSSMPVAEEESYFKLGA